MRVLRGREPEDDNDGEDMGLSDSEELTCVMVGRVEDDGASDSAEDSSMRLGWTKTSDGSVCELRGRVEMDGVSESSEW